MVGFRAHGGGQLVFCIIQQPKGTVQQFIDIYAKSPFLILLIFPRKYIMSVVHHFYVNSQCWASGFQDSSIRKDYISSRYSEQQRKCTVSEASIRAKVK